MTNRGLRKLGKGAAHVGIGRQRLSRRLHDARSYWTADSDPHWLSNSHWRGGLDADLWEQIGQEHLDMFRLFANALDKPAEPGVVIEWGCGGGANAVAFAPSARKFIAADVSAGSVEECVRQIAAVCDTATESLVIDIENPEESVAGLGGTCDTFLCFYVMELTAGHPEALRILRIAEQLLTPNGVAVIQVKYHNGWRTRGLGRDYRRNLANMTTFGIDEFWLSAQECGLKPRLVTLVPQNRLDSRYAYYALTKP
ncbi:class I SAM-dependent methyltransferase [Mycolicibacterium stellerae]|uniref:class I SAM-dependent methyltransferase n=1 Tax=Mycolicibacterium stellerae TaxID=2358193 RepID=UPI000F0B7B44|nr:methyltransferase [Mycolicibacterium stellerae]